MTLGNLFFINAFAVMLVGLFGILTRKNIIKILLSINILQTGVNLLLIALGWVENASAPILTAASGPSPVMVDPLPQALVLTSIVIGFGTTAVGLVIILNYFKTHRSLDAEGFGNQPGNTDDEEVIS